MGNKKLIVIVGETASGKSALGLQAAQRWDGEIICADSRTIYKGMDIGTAKPSRVSRTKVPHHLLDVVEPNEHFSVADFKKRTDDLIEKIQSNGKLPIVVGGTGLYIDAILYDFTFRASANPQLRTELEKLSVDELQKKIAKAKLPMPQNNKNPRHLIRVIESNGQISERGSLRPNTIMIGLRVEPEILKKRIRERVEQMFSSGLEEEVRKIAERYGRDEEALRTIGYSEFQPYFDGVQDLSEVKERIIHNTYQYARRQRTWFKRNPNIQWCDSIEHAMSLLQKLLSTS